MNIWKSHLDKTDMHLTHLSLTNFRNFSRLDTDIPIGQILLTGDNAQGKTSLLEAIYFLSALTSFHAENDRQLVNFLVGREPLAVTRIVAAFQRGNTNHRIEVRVIQENELANGGSRIRKEILIDGNKKKISEAVGVFNAVLFLPQMIQVVEGSPEDRRRFINLALSQVVANYAAVLGEYSSAVTQRNALLKQLNERGGDPSQLEYWDQEVSQMGSRLILARIQSIQELERIAAPIHRELTQGSEIFRLAYQPSFDPLPQPVGQYMLQVDAPVDRSGIPLEKIQEGFLARMQQLRQEEIARGITTVGPHRDELRFLGNGIDLGSYGSRGQVRTAMLALKLAEYFWMKEKAGQWPVFLLDEVLAELDAKRRGDLLKHIVGCEQALLTTTDLNLFTDEFIKRAKVWRIESGRIIG